MHFLRVERRLLTISLIYGIITAEKEFMRSRIFDFLIASSSHQNGLDHSFDHLRLRTTWKQCEREHPKASFSDTKAPKSPRNQGKNRCRFVWEHDVAGSNPVIPTKKGHLSHSDQVSFSFFVRFQSSMYDSVIPNPVSPLANVAFRPKRDTCHTVIWCLFPFLSDSSLRCMTPSYQIPFRPPRMLHSDQKDLTVSVGSVFFPDV